MMGAIQDQMALTDQEKLDRQASVTNNQGGYNPDGSGKANDFHPSQLPQSNWPPQLTADGQFRVHLDALTQVAKHMGDDLAALQGTLSMLKGSGAGGATLYGWATAEGMGTNAGQAYDGISECCQTLSHVYDQVIGYLCLTVANYADAETTTATAASNVGTDPRRAAWAAAVAAGRGTMRTGAGGGWGAVTGNTYQVKIMAVTPESASGMTASVIETLFSGLKPWAVADAGKAHTAAAKTLQSTADSLVRHAQALADGWSGTAAQASIAAFRQLHQTVVQLAQASAQTGQVLTWLGGTILPYYKNWQAPSNGIMGTIESWFGSNPQDQAAQQVMQRLNDRLSQANAALPDIISINPPNIGQPGRAPATTGGSNPGRGVGAAVASAAITRGVRGTVSPAGSGGGVVGVGGRSPGSGGLGVVPPGHGGPAAPPTHLAGLPSGGGTPPGVGSIPGGPGGVPGGGLPGGGVPGGPGPFGPAPMPGQGTFTGVGGIPGEGTPPGAVGIPGEPGGYGEPGAGGAGNAFGGQGLVGEDVGFLPGESAVVGSDGMIGTGPGMAEGELGPGNTGATGFVGADDAATQPGGGLPMTGGSGGGRRENERYRQAWMAEDADTWEGETTPTRR